ncbi:hypothetical protein SDC9_175357 [bioreactor metagenome]|uniref:Uncharacterized protein n=1 Tax=bioreactor metagenome TaxID=1076179 RepID=A0A645GW93_9ZZZZ
MFALFDDDPQFPGGQLDQRADRVDAQTLDESLEDHRVEMAGPFGHALDRLGRVPAGLVGAVGRDGVVYVADCAHLGEQAHRLAVQALGITAAVDFFVMVEADILGHLADTAAFQ